MNWKQLIFPIALAALNFGAAVASFLAGDWKRGLYWIFSGLCIVTVTLK
jgi:hypothetical protein